MRPTATMRAVVLVACAAAAAAADVSPHTHVVHPSPSQQALGFLSTSFLASLPSTTPALSEEVMASGAWERILRGTTRSVPTVLLPVEKEVQSRAPPNWPELLSFGAPRAEVAMLFIQPVEVSKLRRR